MTPTTFQLLAKLQFYVSPDDTELNEREFPRTVANRILDDLAHVEGGAVNRQASVDMLAALQRIIALPIDDDGQSVAVAIPRADYDALFAAVRKATGAA